MIEIKTKIRKWGNSFGIIVPQKVVEDSGVKEGEELSVFLRKKSESNVIKETFGILKNWKKPTDKIMKEIDEELWAEE